MKIIKYICIISGVLLLSACAEENVLPPDVHDVMVEVRPLVPGMLTASSSSGRAGDTRSFTPDGSTLEGKDILPLEEGTTMWLLVYGTTVNNETYKTMKSYVIKGIGNMQTLHPCAVDKDGNVISERVAPLYIPYGSFTFKGLSPARAFLDADGKIITDLTKAEPYRLLIKNGENLISSDERYVQTNSDPQEVVEEKGRVQIIELKPLINQTAQLKFTLYADTEDKYIHRIRIMPTGVEISGLQDHYAKSERKWNWSPAITDTLEAYPGNKSERLVIYGNDSKRIIHKSDKEVEISAAVLPTDAISTSVIVLFNLEVNGVPTQYEMMLNQKILRAAYSYHYRGKVTITNGIVAIEWQHIEWDTDIEIDW